MSYVIPLIGLGAAALLAWGPSPFDLERERLDDSALAASGGMRVRLEDGWVSYTLGEGSGPVVVLIPGGTLPMFIFDPLVPKLEARGFRVLRYDLYGRGFSDRVAAAHAPALYRRQLEQLLERLDIYEPIDIVGLALGALIGADFARAHPGRVRLLGAIAPDGFGTELPLSARAARLPVIGAPLGRWLARLLGDRLMLSRVERLVLDPEHTAPIRARLRETLRFRGTKRALISLLRSGMPIDAGAELFSDAARSGTRLFAIWGAGDRVTPPVLAERFRAAVPSATVHLLADAGHLPQYERPDEVAERIAAERDRVSKG